MALMTNAFVAHTQAQIKLVMALRQRKLVQQGYLTDKQRSFYKTWIRDLASCMEMK